MALAMVALPAMADLLVVDLLVVGLLVADLPAVVMIRLPLMSRSPGHSKYSTRLCNQQ